MNGNNQKLDAFSDLTLGSLDKYDERNRDAHKQKEADALDRRIRNFCERERNLEWANEAIEFCEKEKRDCVRLEGYSKEAHRLNDIRREAEKIIKEDKLYKEEMQKKLEQQAKEADDMILMLDLAPRNRYWAEEAKRVDAEIKNLPANLRLMLTNISLMDKLMKEIGYIEEGVKYDEIIHALRLEGVHDHKWAERMIEVGESIPEHLIQYMTEANELNSLKAEAKKIQADHIRAERERVELPIVRPYEKLIESYRTAVFDNVVITSLTEVDKNYYTFFMNNYKKLNGELGSLGFDPGDYISNFRSLWKSL